MLAWLYDEDRWLFGATGGLVTVDPQFRGWHRLFTCVPYGSTPGRMMGQYSSSARAERNENGFLLAR
jgi:hypothetical protein